MSEIEDKIKYMQARTKADIELIRSMTRPIVTVVLTVGWIIFLFMLYQNGKDFSGMPAVFTYFVAAANAWVFGERSIAKVFHAITDIKEIKQ